MIERKKYYLNLLMAFSLALAAGGAYAKDTPSRPTESVAGQPMHHSENATQSAATPSRSGEGSLPAGSSGSGAQGATQADTTGDPADNSTSGASSTEQGQRSASGAQSNDAALVYMAVPVGVVTADEAMKRGCWVQLFAGQDYSGESLTLVGPTTVRNMSGPFGINWDDRVKSLKAGPNARLSVFDDEEYEERVAQFKPGQQVPDVSKQLGFFDEFGSIRLECQPG